MKFGQEYISEIGREPPYSKTYDGETYGIGPKISLLSGEFIRQFKLSPSEQKFYCYTSKEINTQAIYNQTIYDDPQNIFELLSMLEEIELNLFDEYLNCIGNAFQVSQGRDYRLKFVLGKVHGLWYN